MAADDERPTRAPEALRAGRHAFAHVFPGAEQPGQFVERPRDRARRFGGRQRRLPQALHEPAAILLHDHRGEPAGGTATIGEAESRLAVHHRHVVSDRPHAGNVDIDRGIGIRGEQGREHVPDGSPAGSHLARREIDALATVGPMGGDRRSIVPVEVAQVAVEHRANLGRDVSSDRRTGRGHRGVGDPKRPRRRDHPGHGRSRTSRHRNRVDRLPGRAPNQSHDRKQTHPSHDLTLRDEARHDRPHDTGHAAT